MIFIDYTCAKECKNTEESMGMTCVKCGKCGRKFNNEGAMIDNGGTTPNTDD